MGIAIGVKLKTFIGRFKKPKQPTKQELFNLEIEHKLQMVADGFEKLMETNWNNLHEGMVAMDKAISNEKSLRKSQGKRANDKFKEEMKTVNENFSKIDVNISKINDIVNKKTAKMSDLIQRFEWALENFNRIEDLTLKANSEYDSYLCEMQSNYDSYVAKLKKEVTEFKRDISEFKKNDNAVVRLTGLETRITLLEIEQQKLIKSPATNIHTLENNRIG